MSVTARVIQLNAGPEDSVADEDNLYEDDASSNALQDFLCAEVIDVTGKAVSAQAPSSPPIPKTNVSQPPVFPLPPWQLECSCVLDLLSK